MEGIGPIGLAKSLISLVVTLLPRLPTGATLSFMNHGTSSITTITSHFSV